MSKEKHRFKFQKINHLRKRDDILEVLRTGKKSFSKNLVIYFLVKKDLPPRICISVSIRGRNNVQRNRLRRQIRETFRLNNNLFVEGLQLLVNVKNGIKEMGTEDLATEFLMILKKNRLIKEQKKAGYKKAMLHK